ncbi:MAG: hypothetical protein IT531_07825 [Burkholderiales bacterium]|nr:hypothetical protein [Burkholderiales bacterium]
MIRFALLVFTLLLVLDFALRVVERRTFLVTEIVDIQTPATLYSKLDYLRRFDGLKVVVLGDSVVYGRAMADAGEREWRRHTLSAQLQDRLFKLGLDRPVLVLNLGMNGALMKDIERLVGHVLAAGTDKLILDVTLRSFSGDFSRPGEDISRPWMERFVMDPAGRYVEETSSVAATQRLESALREFMINHWALYRLRDLIQWRVFNGEPATAARALRTHLNRWWGGESDESSNALFAGPLLRLKAKNRHDSVTLDASNPQVAAFQRTLATLTAHRIDTVVFYATEDAEQMKDIMAPQRHGSLLKELSALIGAAGGSRVTYVPPLTNLRPEHFVDYVHPNRSGYAVLADALVGALRLGSK